MSNDNLSPPSPETTTPLSADALPEPRALHLVVSNGPVAKAKQPVAPPEVQLAASLAGVVDAFTKLAAWQGVIGWDDFAHRMVFRRDPPFRTVASRSGQAVGEEDIVRMRLWLEVERGLQVSGKLVTDALQLVSRQHRFHPVADYLSSLTWDGQARVDTWLEDFCSVQPASPDHQLLIRAVARKWLVSCVARAMNPGCKVDTMLILEGKQGLGKSTLLRELAGASFFSDALISFGTKDACQSVQGVWIYELPELDAVLRGDTGSTKAFLSRPTDRFRAPYTRAPVAVPRSVVFAGTVNHGSYLKDRSGNRRFWVVKCGEALNVEGMRASRDQLWAEARALFESGEPWHLSTEEDALMREQQEERMEVEPWEEAIVKWVSGQGDRPLGIEEVLEHALGMKAASRNPNVTRRAHDILERLGFQRQRKAFDEPGRRVYRYVRQASESCPSASLPYCPEDDAVPSAEVQEL